MNQPFDTDQLRRFHASHFPGQPVPDLKFHEKSPTSETSAAQNPGRNAADTDSLGYYPDGVKRTLTDDQIRMFRHSEIQRLLNERRATREAEEKARKKELRRESAVDTGYKKRRFDEFEERAPVDTLMYDDDTEVVKTVKQPPEKHFLWPTLGP